MRVHVRIITIRAAAHHSRWGWRLVNICICLVWIKISLCSCKCQTLLFQKVDSHTVYFLCAQKWHRNSKQGWQINLGLHYCSLLEWGWQSTAMVGGGGSGLKCRCGRWLSGKLPEKVVVSRSCWSKEARRESGSNDSQRIHETQHLNSTRQCCVRFIESSENNQGRRWNDVDRQMLRWQHTQTQHPEPMLPFQTQTRHRDAPLLVVSEAVTDC